MTVEVCCYFWIKPGGFNRSDYGDETDATPSVRGFNYFNNPSILILISKLILSCYFNGRWGTNYFADIIELKLVLRQD
jgi:hypothetical protein